MGIIKAGKRSSSSFLGSQKIQQTVTTTWPLVIRERTCLHAFLSIISLSVIDLFLMSCLMLFEKLG